VEKKILGATKVYKKGNLWRRNTNKVNKREFKISWDPS
jgi:hypothetical protein